LTERFLAAVALANEVHGGRSRLGTEIPYLAHLLVVTGLVFEDGGDENQAIAALLHDAVEDGGGRAMLERIRDEETRSRRSSRLPPTPWTRSMRAAGVSARPRISPPFQA
jgi:hypothetical protein